MNSFSILLLLGIGTLVAFLLLVAEVRYFMRYKEVAEVRYFMRYKEFQTVREKMNHADSWKEFVFWHALACTEALEILHQTAALAVWQYVRRLMVLRIG